MEPEVRLTSERIFDGRILNLRVDAVALPGGGEATREVVEHRPACVIVPLDGDGDVLLVRQYRHAVGEVLLEAPAGLVEEGELPEECARRELPEETGHAAADIERIGAFWPSPGFCDELMHVFLARGLTPGQPSPDEDENIEVVRYPLERVLKMIESGEIRDGKTIAAVLMTSSFLGKLAPADGGW